MTAVDLRTVANAAKRARLSTESRNHWICVAYGNGFSLREIANAADLSHSAIAKIVKRS